MIKDLMIAYLYYKRYNLGKSGMNKKFHAKSYIFDDTTNLFQITEY